MKGSLVSVVVSDTAKWKCQLFIECDKIFGFHSALCGRYLKFKIPNSSRSNTLKYDNFLQGVG